MTRFARVILPFILILILQNPQVSCGITNSFEVKDLQYTAADVFATDIDNSHLNSWSCSDPSFPIYTECDSTPVLGGPGILNNNAGAYYETSYSGLESHDTILFSFTFFIWGPWNGASGDSFKISFDGAEVASITLAQANLRSPTLCSNLLTKASQIKVFGKASHNRGDLDLRITSQLASGDSSTVSFGFRDIDLVFTTAAKTSDAVTLCTTGTTTGVNTTPDCACAEGKYKNSATGTCSSCDSSCSSCFGDSNVECHRCAPGYSFNGLGCIKCHEYCDICFGFGGQDECGACGLDYYQSGTVCIDYCETQVFSEDCDGPRATCKNDCNDYNYLTYDPDCDAVDPPDDPPVTVSRRLSDDGDILPSGRNLNCMGGGPPLGPPIVLTRRLDSAYLSCVGGGGGGSPVPSRRMASGSENLGWEAPADANYNFQDCLTTCIDYGGTTHYEQSIWNGFKACFDACPSGTYTWSNGTCTANCDSPFVKSNDGGVDTCDSPCTGSQVLSTAGRCVSSCAATEQITTYGDKKYCTHNEAIPTAWECAWTSEYLSSDALTCMNECDLTEEPYRSPYGNSCKKCLDNQFYNIETEKCERLIVPDTPATGPSSSSSSSSSNSKVSFFTLVKMLHYIRYLDIEFPPRLQRLAVDPHRTPLSLRFGFRLPQKTQAKFTRYPLPVVFATYGLHSSFLVTYWLEFTCLMFTITTGVIFWIIEKICEKKKFTTVKKICERIRVTAGFNFFLILVATGIDDLVLSISLQFKSMRADNVADGFSCFMAVFFLLAGLGYLIGTFFTVRQAHSSKKSGAKDEHSEFLLDTQNTQVLYRGYNEDKLHKQLFFMIYVSRIALPMIFACALYPWPIAQVIFYNLISIGILSYVIIFKPLRQKINQIQLILLESFVLVVNLCGLILTILSKNGSSQSKAAIFFGDVIVVFNWSIHILAFVFLGLKLLIWVSLALKIRKSQGPKEQAAWLQFFYIYFQQGGFGFEHVQIGSYVADGAVKSSSNKASSKKVFVQKVSPEPQPNQLSPEGATPATAIPGNILTVDAKKKSPFNKGLKFAQKAVEMWGADLEKDIKVFNLAPKSAKTAKISTAPDLTARSADNTMHALHNNTHNITMNSPDPQFVSNANPESNATFADLESPVKRRLGRGNTNRFGSTVNTDRGNDLTSRELLGQRSSINLPN